MVIQFNYGLFNFPKFSDFLQKITSCDVNVIIFLHSTIDPPHNQLKRLDSLKIPLNKCKRIFVHTIPDLNRLKEIGLIENVSLFPHGILDFENKSENNPSQSHLRGKDKTIHIASFGFCLPNKGYRELILACNTLIHNGINLKLSILSLLHS